ncbi:unnamed protein product [Closterium sp. NIES-54]
MVVVLERQLHAVKINKGDDVRGVFNQLRDLYVKLSAAGVDYLEKIKCYKALSLLPESWGPLVVNLNGMKNSWSLEFPHRSPTALLLPLAVLTLAAVSESARLASVSSVVSTFSSPKLVNDSSPSSSSSSSSSTRSASSSASVSFAVSSVESHDDVAELEDEVSAPRRMMLAPGWMLWRMANSNRCRPSSLQGYTSSRKLGNGLVLHWRATTGKRLRVAVMARAGTEAAAAGWFAVGWSPKGDMDGSNVVAREADSAPIAYDLSGHDDATESRSWGVQDASVEHTANGVILRFTRIKGDGSSVGIKTWEGFNYIVFAYGMGITIGDHQYRNTMLIDFTCGCGLLRFRC